MSNIKLYRHPLSGHSHRVELFLSILGLKADIIDVDVMGGEHKQPKFLSKNIFGQIPVLEDGATTLSDSNAILAFLASKYDTTGTWLPANPEELSAVQRFLSVAAGSVAFGPAAARLVNVFGADLNHEQAKERSNDLLATLNDHLWDRKWLATQNPTIADIANYTYIAHAPEGDISLVPYPHVTAWLRRVEALAGFVPMQRTEVGLAA
jgi:glutathione S-transferase